MTSTGPVPVPRIDLARVVDLAAQLEADAQLDPDALRRRDRSIGRELSGRVADATARVEMWLDARRRGAGPSAGEHAQWAQRVFRVLLVAAGLVSGSGMALAVFAYDGTRPVNVVGVLAIFVALPALLLVATALLALPEAWRRRVPALAALQDVLRLASPGRWQPALRGLLAPAQRDAFDRAAGLARRHQRLYGDVQKWTLFVGSQLFAVAFHVAALGTAAALVTFSDLAFGWSTTLEVDAARLHRFSQWLATPWARVLPDAVPSLTLIQQTQYFRGAGGFVGDPARSAAWWRFLLACMACYGLAPRLAVLAAVVARQRVALRRAFEQMPGVAELRDRLDSRWVATALRGSEAAPPEPAARARAAPAARPARVSAVRWSGVPVSDSLVGQLVSELLGAELTDVSDGGAGSRRSDAALIAELTAAGDAPLWIVKAWEPPMLELLDLLGELRQVLGNATPILVLPVGLDGQGRIVAAREADARTWGRRLDALGDPWLEVVSAA